MTDLIINALNWIYKVVFALLPELPSEVSEVLGNLSGNSDVIFELLNQINFVIPLPTIVTIICIDLAVRIFFFALYIVNKGGKVVLKLLGIVF